MSVIRRHFPVLWPLGITPKRLTCRDGALDMGNGPRNRPSDSSLVRYCDTVSACRAAEGMFESDDFSGAFRWKPILKPSRRPRMTYWAYALSGWDWRAASHACTLRGVDTDRRSETLVGAQGRQRSRQSRSDVYGYSISQSVGGEMHFIVAPTGCHTFFWWSVIIL